MDKTPDPMPQIDAAFQRAFSLGQTYWHQADSDSYKQNAKAHETADKFDALVQDALALIRSAIAPQPAQGAFDKWWWSAPHRTKYSTDHSAYLAARETYDAFALATPPTPAPDEAAVRAKFLEWLNEDREARGYQADLFNAYSAGYRAALLGDKT